MAKIRFKTRTNEVIKSKYVEKKTFKTGLGIFCVIFSFLLVSLYRLYILNDFQTILQQITTYYSSFETFVKGLF